MSIHCNTGSIYCVTKILYGKDESIYIYICTKKFVFQANRMSSSYVIEPQENNSEKKDDTLIIVVNDDGIISVDQATLQNLISKQLQTS